jgi:nicotinic acid phosphoribosyltransferase
MALFVYSGLPSFAGADEAFFSEYLATLDTSEVVIYAIKEGTVVFPRVPLLRHVAHSAPLFLCVTTAVVVMVMAGKKGVPIARFCRRILLKSVGSLVVVVYRVEGPLGICQMLETVILNLANFPSYVSLS